MLQPNYRFLSTGDLKNLPDDKQYIKNILKSVEKITEEGPYFSNGLAPSVNKGEPSILQYIADAFSNREYEVLVQELHHVDGKWTFSSSVSFLSKIRKDHKETLEAQCVFEVVNGKPSALQYLTIKKNTRLNKSINGFSGHEEKINLHIESFNTLLEEIDEIKKCSSFSKSKFDQVKNVYGKLSELFKITAQDFLLCSA